MRNNFMPGMILLSSNIDVPKSGAYNEGTYEDGQVKYDPTTFMTYTYDADEDYWIDEDGKTYTTEELPAGLVDA